MMQQPNAQNKSKTERQGSEVYVIPMIFWDGRNYQILGKC